MTVVAKFGGTSMATVDSIRQVGTILRSDDARRVAVVSAPGCTRDGTDKVTDLLYRGELDAVEGRLVSLMTGLQIDPSPLSQMVAWIARRPVDVQVAFGEYMSAYILAKYLGWRFVDARRVLVVTASGFQILDGVLRHYLSRDERVVVPGFYGATDTGDTTLLPRGGSDISGALLAAALDADRYENWTDVDGVFDSDPRRNFDAVQLHRISYRDMYLRSLSGAKVLHPAAIHPVAVKGIPIHIRNTFRPHLNGTCIS